MGNWLSSFTSASPNSVPAITPDETVVNKLNLYVKSLNADMIILSKKNNDLAQTFVSVKEMHGVGPELRSVFNEQNMIGKQRTAVQTAIQAVSEQLNTLYQQNLNHQTMLLMRESAMVMLKTSQSGMNPDKTLAVMDDYNDTIEERSELAAHMFAAVKSDAAVAATEDPSTDASWDAYIASQLPVDNNSQTPSAPPLSTADLPTAPVLASAVAAVPDPCSPSVKRPELVI